MKKAILFVAVLTTVLLAGCQTTPTRVDCNETPEHDLCSQVVVDPTDKEDCEDTNTCEVEDMRIKDVEQLTQTVEAGELIEFRIDTEGLSDELNVYDSKDVNITMIFKKDDLEIKRPAFWYQDYDELFNEDSARTPSGISGQPSTETDEIQGVQSLVQVGDGEFRVRANLNETGTYEYIVTLESNGKTYKNYTGSITVTNASEDFKGFIEITDNRYFSFTETEEAFIPIGQNTAWYTSSTRKSRDYQVWFEEMNKAGMNAGRVWMATWGFALEWGTDGLHNYDNRQNQAFRLDQVLNYADENNIYFLLTILNHGQFSYSTNAEWENNPWNEDNGGILNLPSDFFKDEEAKEIFKDQLRYIVARYGYSDNILAWELFNEVDWVDNYSDFNGKKWHEEMATYLKEIDQNHLVTTSVKGTSNYLLTSTVLDFINTHDYGYRYKNINEHLGATQRWVSSEYGNPVWMSEIGTRWDGGYQSYQDDPTGIALRQQTWAGALGGGLGGAMNWWWDSYVNPYDLYNQFTGFSIYAKEMDITGSDFSHLATLAGVDINSSNVGMEGYRIDNRVYGYVFNKDFSHMNPNPTQIGGVEISIPIDNGTYTVSYYDTYTGAVTKTETITVTNNKITLDYGSVKTDSAFIIN